MKKIVLPLSILAVVMLSGCGSTMRIYSDLDEEGRFGDYATYSFMDFSEGNQKTIPGMELERIRVACARELEQRGLKYDGENGDVSVKITVYHRLALDGYYWHPWRYTYMERAISVDMYDNQTRKHVWHCAAVDELEYDTDERAAKFPEVVAAMFHKYPVQPPASI